MIKYYHEWIVLTVVDYFKYVFKPASHLNYTNTMSKKIRNNDRDDGDDDWPSGVAF